MTSRSAHETRLQKAFAGPEAGAFRRIQQTALLLLEDLSGMLAEHELSLPLYDALRVLFEAGEEGLSARALGERMMNRSPDVTRLLDRLEQQGLADRQRDGADRRVVVARLTPLGQEVLLGVAEPVARLHREQLGHLSVKSLTHLSALLDRAREGGLSEEG